MFNSISGRIHEHTIIVFVFLFRHLVYFSFKNQYKIVLNIVKNFFLFFMMPIKTWQNWNDCIIFCYKKNLEISFQNGHEHEITSLT